MSSLTSVASAAATPERTSRRCWRCLDEFPVDVEPGDRLDGWWLCAPCNDVLLPSKRVPS